MRILENLLIYTLQRKIVMLKRIVRVTFFCMIGLIGGLQAVDDKDSLISALKEVNVKLVKKLLKGESIDKKRKKLAVKAAKDVVRECKKNVLLLEIGRDFAWSTWLGLGTIATFLGIQGPLLVNKNTIKRDALFILGGAVSFTLSAMCYLHHPSAVDRLENACEIEDLIKNTLLFAEQNGVKSI